MTPICTTDALDSQERSVRVERSRTWPRPIPSPEVGGGTDLAMGTAGPAPTAILAAGLVIMTEVPLPTLHVPHTHGRTEGQAGGMVVRIHLLLTGSGLHIAGIPSWAAVLAVLTAHSLQGQNGFMLLFPPPPRT